jgi:Zn-dependent M28 family amino/carboxypeptidase
MFPAFIRLEPPMRDVLFMLGLGLGLWAPPPATKTAAQPRFDGSSWWSLVRYLADDSLEGRDTASRGIQRAQAYAVEQLQRAGFAPAGDDGFYQRVRLSEFQVDEGKSSLALVGKEGTERLSFADDAFISTRATHASVSLTAPLVFVGYGLRVPERHLDELGGIDLKGKVAVYLSGSPAEVPTDLAAHYQAFVERWKVMRAAGAIGVVSIPNPASMDVPWSRMALNRNHPAMDLADPEFDEAAGSRIAVTFNPAAAEKLFRGSGHGFAEIAALGRDRKPLPQFGLAASLQAKATIRTARRNCANIVARLAGTDPKLKEELVVLSAHLDHVGLGEPIRGDRTYNGAMDDGSGSALVLDLAAELSHHPIALKRSLLFLLVTGEEKGLLGSKYFAQHPTVRAGSLVADINVDMFLPIVPLKVMRILGIADSDLGERAARITRSMGVKAVPDPEPLRNLFIRSDQYNFIRHGVPSVIMDVFYEPDSTEQKRFKEWLSERYHAPSDDANQPVSLDAAAKYEEIVRALLIETANEASRPTWKASSFFRRYAAP